MKLTFLFQLVDKFQQAGKIDNLQQVCGVSWLCSCYHCPSPDFLISHLILQNHTQHHSLRSTSAVFNFLFSFFFSPQHSEPYVTTALTTAVYILAFALIGILLSFKTVFTSLHFFQLALTLACYLVFTASFSGPKYFSMQFLSIHVSDVYLFFSGLTTYHCLRLFHIHL